MGLVEVQVELVNSDDLALCARGYLPHEGVRRVTVSALVDTGACMLAVNEDVRSRLDLKKIDEKEAVLADGSKRKLDVVGPVDVRFENRATTVRAMVLPGDTQILLGAIPLEDMDVVVDSRQQRLIVNPESPSIPKTSLRRLA